MIFVMYRDLWQNRHNNQEYSHEIRKDIDVKNLFSCGQVSESYVIELIKLTSGDTHETSPHHADNSITVHVFKPYKDGKYWYVKFYFIEPDVVFISVHT